MSPYLRDGEIKILALPLAQEATDKPANTPSSIDKLQKEYGSIVDFHRCLDVYVDYDSKKGRWSPEDKSLKTRALELRKFLRDREEEEIVVVSHGDFLHYVSGDVDEEGNQLKGWWTNTECRSYRFFPVGHEEALLEETEESVRMRGARGKGEVQGSAKEEARKDEGVKNRE